jgi:hypothetical protein
VRLHAHGVDHRVGPAPIGQRADLVAGVVEVVQVERLHPARLSALDAVGLEIHADHPVAAVQRDPAAHVADRPEAEHEDRAAVRDPGVLHRLPGGRQHVGEV